MDASEPPRGCYFVYAFEAICRACATQETTVEICFDDDTFPDMLDFVCGRMKPQCLPESKYGAPAVGYWNAGLGLSQINMLAQLDCKTIAIAKILGVLDAARATGNPAKPQSQLAREIFAPNF
jgi:hypothetical protein